MSDDRRAALSSEVGEISTALWEQRFVPQRYEPNYAYPLLVMFHGRGGDEHQLIEAMPAMSWRNYVAVGLRGPETLRRDGQVVGHAWGGPFGRLENRAPRVEGPVEVVRRVLSGDAPDGMDRIEDGTFNAIRGIRRALHVHSERIYLLGMGEGAAVAYWLALSHPERFAGVVALNGWLPRTLPVLKRCRDCREHGFKALVVHGEWNGRAPVARARRDAALLRSAGLSVAFQTYPCANRLTAPMLADVDTWLIHQCTSRV